MFINVKVITNKHIQKVLTKPSKAVTKAFF